MINAYVRNLIILFITGINISKLLWVPVRQRKPAALNLDHQAVSLFKCMSYIRQTELNGFYFPRLEGNGCFKTFPVFTPEYFSTYQHLISSHGIYSFGFVYSININALIRKTIRKNVYDFHYKISI